MGPFISQTSARMTFLGRFTITLVKPIIAWSQGLSHQPMPALKGWVKFDDWWAPLWGMPEEPNIFFLIAMHESRFCVASFEKATTCYKLAWLQESKTLTEENRFVSTVFSILACNDKSMFNPFIFLQKRNNSSFTSHILLWISHGLQLLTRKNSMSNVYLSLEKSVWFDANLNSHQKYFWAFKTIFSMI